MQEQVLAAPVLFCSFDVGDESDSVESEISSAPGVRLLAIWHLVELRPVVVVAIHANDESVDSVCL